ncbi:MAG: sulfotransferase family protein [Rudaea sp.]
MPIIIGGCHRSGTSLLRRIINAHSRIYCGPEIKLFRDLYNDYYYERLVHERFLSTAQSVLSRYELLDMLGPVWIDIHTRAAAQAGKPRWADKNPENIVYAQVWERLLGDQWLLVHIVRNPLDTLASIKEARFDNTIPPNLHGRIDFYRRYNEAGLKLAAEMQSRYYRLAYEELVMYPEETLGKLMEWLGEEFEISQLDFNRTPVQKGTEDPKIRETTKIHQQSVGRWPDILMPEEAAVVRHELEPLWKQFDPECRWMTSGTARPPSAAPPGPTPGPSGAPASKFVEIDPLADLLMRMIRDRQEARVAFASVDAWAKELSAELTRRDDERERLRSLLPVRVVLALGNAWRSIRPRNTQ